jgi:hypothetical protein
MSQGNDQFKVFSVIILPENKLRFVRHCSRLQSSVPTARQTGMLKKLPHKHGDFGIWDSCMLEYFMRILIESLQI